MRELPPAPDDRGPTGPGPAGGPRGAFGRASARARDLGASVRSRSAEGVDRALDRVFAEPFDVPDAETARRLLSGAEPPPTGVLGRFLEGQALVKIAGQVTKLAGRSKAARAATRVAALPAAMAETGAAGATGAAAGSAAMSTATSMGAAALAAAAVAATTRATRTARRGLNDLRVLASYLTSRARAEHVDLDPGLLRVLTLATYVDPRRRADFRLTGSRGGAAVLGRWSRETTVPPSELRRRDDIDAWLHAIDRLELDALREEWARRD
jgi:hypothetical protein